MRRISTAAAAAVILALLLRAGPAAAAQPAAEAQDQVAAQRLFNKLVDEYLHSDFTAFETSLRDITRCAPHLSADQRSDIAYMRKTYAEFRPPWWKSTRSSRNVTFTATIWGKPIKANYMPSEAWGYEIPIGIDERTGRFIVVVTWQPHKVDSPKELEGTTERAHRMTEGDLTESIIWHELGHNYVEACLPASQIIALYSDYRMLFEALGEFYADMTAMYHCSPQGRKATMVLRTPELRWNDVNDPHVRAAHAIGAVILASVLEDPNQWPSFRLPTKVPTQAVERNTLLYMYQHLDPAYSVAEDRKLREVIYQFIRAQGASILRKKGTLTLPNGCEMKIMTAEDRPLQAQRDAWVKEKLEKAIASGAAKTVTATQGHPKRFGIKTTW